MAELITIQDGSPHPARWWTPEGDNRVHCYLCPRDCKIHDGQQGFCYIRVNRGGKLYSLGYGRPAAMQVDPIEKKPLNHFLPGTKVFSLGTAGCNMGCFFCQNWEISKSKSDQVRSSSMNPLDIVEAAVQSGCDSIAFTFNEPTIWGEYVVDIAREARAAGLKTVMVTNGYVAREPFLDIYQHIDAANVDLKAFTEDFYRRVTLTELKPVLDMLMWLNRDTEVWFELTTLLIPGLNDGEQEVRELSGWIAKNLGNDVPLHFTAFHPDFKLRDRPRTSPETLRRARQVAIEEGLHFVYEGNIATDASHTHCPGCGEVVVTRSWHTVLSDRLREGECPECGNALAGRWKDQNTFRQVATREAPSA